ncbi:ornithine decarboxylase antizyme-domain-containing protein [Xylariaceae sp. FL1272]|nr:ornithine decarboxylase antizyme-domain-containing protein [Xylariaceae sp. FL1272]
MSHNHLALDLTGTGQDMSHYVPRPQSIEIPPEYDQQTGLPSDGHMNFSPTSQTSDKNPIARFYMNNDGPWHPLVTDGTVAPRLDQFSSQGSGRPSLVQSELDSGYGSYHQQLRHSVTNGSVCDDTLATDFDEQSIIYSVPDSSFVPDAWQRQRPSAFETPIPFDPMKCDTCFKSVRTKSELKKHHQRHTKPFKCDVEDCQRHTEGFSTVNDLDRHKRSVHPNTQAGGNRYRCTLGACKSKLKIWPRADNFKAHLKRLHQKDPITDEELNTFLYIPSSLPDDQESQSVYSEATNTTYGPSNAWPQFEPPQKMNSTTTLSRGHSGANLSLPSSQQDVNDMSVSMSRVMSRQESYPNNICAESQSIAMPSSTVENSQLRDDTDMSDIVPAVQPNPASNKGQSFYQNGVNKSYNSQPVASNESSPYQHAANEAVQAGFETDTSYGLLTNPSTTTNSSLPSVNQVSLNIDDPAAVKELLMKLQTKGMLAQFVFKDDHVDGSNPPPPAEVRKPDSQYDGHPCPICSKIFVRRCELKKHEKRHEKPYGCTQPDCDKRFGSKNDWKRHENTQHFMLESWRCEEKKSNLENEPCERVSYRRENFKNHLEVDHGITDQHTLERKMEKCRVGRNCEARFWCGFCGKIVEIKQKNMQPWVERFNHIDEHFTGKNQRQAQEIGEWKNFDPTQPKKGSPLDDSDSISEVGVVLEAAIVKPKPQDVSSSLSDPGSAKPKRKRDESGNASGTKKNKHTTVGAPYRVCGPSGIPEVPISGLPSPPSSPPLAAITSSNELALQPKPKKRHGRSSSDKVTTSLTGRSTTSSRRGGAAFQIRDECERFFCETMRAVFQGERNRAGSGSFLSGASCATNAQQLTPPYDNMVVEFPPTPPSSLPRDGLTTTTTTGVEAKGWMEFWDYKGGASFRAFLAEDGDEKSLFAFIDGGLIGRDLKHALVAFIELADVPLGCSHVIICLDRLMPEDHSKALMKSLQWVGFELTTLDHWAGEIDVISDKWLFMGMEV